MNGRKWLRDKHLHENQSIFILSILSKVRNCKDIYCEKIPRLQMHFIHCEAMLLRRPLRKDKYLYAIPNVQVSFSNVCPLSIKFEFL